jgi:ketosteroid isomerase-like protein
MKKSMLIVSLLTILLGSCIVEVNKNSIEKWKQEIKDTEIAFSDLAQKEGIPQAFLAYAADDAVLLRGDNLTIGKEAIKISYGEIKSPDGSVSLVWKPDFVDVSSSGDLGYTYGKYTYSVTDSTGNTKSSTGVFHTVWKRQDDGNWKFVWD